MRAPDLRAPVEVLLEEKLLTADDLARVLSTPRRKVGRKWVNRWLRKSGAGFQLVDRGPWFTTRQRLRERFPSVLDLVLEDAAERGGTEGSE